MLVYLDNSATTKPCGEAIDAVQDAMNTHWHNPSALYKPALDAEKKMEEARKAVLQPIHAAEHSLVFTASGTEADNLAIFGWLRTLHRGGRVLYSSVEHTAVSACMEEVRRMGFSVETISVDERGVIDLDRLEKQLTSDVVLLCVMQVNNEVGAVMPLTEIARMRDRLAPGAALHVDGVQGYLRIPLDFEHSGIQSYALSGHKIHAVKGIGALVIRHGHRLHPQQHGGGQEQGLRSGTENIPGILSIGAAVKAFPKDALAHMSILKRQLWEGIREAVPEAILNGPEPGSAEAAPHILNVSLPPVRSQTMLFALEGSGIYVSAGSACASHKQKISPVLSAMRLTQSRADSALRFSLSPYTTAEEIAYAADAVNRHWHLLSRYTRR